MIYAGIDIGSTSAKTVLLDDDGKIIYSSVRPTGWSSVETAEDIKKAVDLQFPSEQKVYTATGYGRVSVPYAERTVTEITCHAKGAVWISRQPDLMVIDIGGQDTKIICTKQGNVTDFYMNDKCSAGTGRFLEVMAGIMGVKPDELCELARLGKNTSINSMCTVFAESEVIGLIGKGESRENIAYAIVSSIAEKVTSQCSRLSRPDIPVILTGGLCDCAFMKEVLEKMLGTQIYSDGRCRYAGAIGAALIAMEKHKQCDIMS